MSKLATGALAARLRDWFPDREFFMRSQGQVRFIRLSSRLQMAVAGLAGALAALWLATMAAVAVSSLIQQQDQTSLKDREARAISAESRVAAYRQDVNAVAGDLARRQDFIEKMVQAHVGELPTNNAADPHGTGEAQRTVKKVSAILPEAAPLARMEARQLAFVAGLTAFADHRSAAAEAAMRRLGLNPARILAAREKPAAMGGPLLALSTSIDGTVDPRFRRLGEALARMDLLEQGLRAIPQVQPADYGYVSSSFGYRADPFTHAAAFHAGLDFPGPFGAPVHAAAKGQVSYIGQRSGYGNCVDVDHGNGLLTRYAHLSGFRAAVGQQVEAGTVIGAIGSTGRSTAPHLHFEVRINDQPVNPRRFLESAPHVLKEARS